MIRNRSLRFEHWNEINRNNSFNWDKITKIFIPQKNITLKRLSMVSLITNMWSCGVLKDDLQRAFSSKNLNKERASLIQNARNIVERLGLPVLLLKDTLDLVDFISHDFISYLDYLMNNEFYFYKCDAAEIIRKIQWDMHGSLNEVQTFKNMNYANYNYNFVTSAFYCLEEDIPIIWARLTPMYHPIFTLKWMYSRGYDSYATYIIYYWTCHAKNRAFQIHLLADPVGLFTDLKDYSTNLKMLILSLHRYNVYSFKYFWYKLEHNEHIIATELFCDKYELVDLCVINNFYDTLINSVEIFLFVLSQINNYQKIQVICKCLPQMIVNFWQCWQVHHVILPLFKTYVSILDPITYKQLFHRLIKQNGRYTPRGKLLYKMWLVSPPHLQSLIDENDKKLLLECPPPMR